VTVDAAAGGRDTVTAVAEPVAPESHRDAGAHPRRDGTGLRLDVQGLRAVAVVVVVLYHAGVPLLQGGYVGVDVFFVISGFVITSALLREMADTGRLSVRAFYGRRMMRLLPAAVLVLAATLIGSWLWLPSLRWHRIALDALAASGYFLNYRFAAQGTDYMSADQAPSPLQHFWSLAVEEQFYVVWPVLLGVCALWLFRRRLRRWPAVVVTGLLAAVSFAFGIWETAHSEPWSYFGSPSRAWELAVGALVALSTGTLSRLHRRVAWVLAWAGLLAVGAAVVLFSATTAFPGYAAALPVLGAAAVIAAGCRPASAAGQPLPAGSAGRILSATAFQGIGRLSYSWYLWHWPLLVIAPIALDVTLRAGQGIVLAALSLILAGITYVAVEDPLRSLASLRARPWRGIGTGLGLSGVLALATVAALLVIPSQVGSGQGSDTRTALANATVASSQLATLIDDGTRLQQVPANLTPSLDQAAEDRPLLYQDGCDPGFTGSTVTKVCAYGDPTSSTSVVLFGDSHAGHWFPALASIATQRHWKLYVMTKSACSVAISLIYLDALKRPYTECVSWRTAAIAWMQQHHPSMIVMSSNNGGPAPLNTTGDADAAWTDAWANSARALSEPGTKLVLISDTPWPGADVPDCLSAHLEDARRCARPAAKALSVPRRRAMVGTALSQLGVQVVEPVSWFCTATLCPPIVGNILVYKDDSHLSTAYSQALAPVLGEQLSLPTAGSGTTATVPPAPGRTGTR
jgi:peptidoglycan/LPS O-acetylase OafA/YrhL